MTRLVAFGCSYTYGQGLPDCFIKLPGPRWFHGPGVQASKYAWPSLVADKLGLKCANISRPGASNLEILHKILNFQFEKDDTVFVMWSFYDRDLLFLSRKEELPIITGSDEPIFEHWLQVHGDIDNRKRAWLYIYTAYLHLKKLNLKFYFLNACHDRLFMSLKPEYASDVKFLNANLHALARSYPKALDEMHPGIGANIVLTHRILSEVKECQD